MLATTHIILLFFGIFQMCSTKMPDCTQLMLPNQLCATLTCFPVPWCSSLNALNCPVPFFFLIISKLMDWSGAVSAYPHESAILPTYSCVCHRWRSYCSSLFLGLFSDWQGSFLNPISHLRTYLWIAFTGILSFESADQEYSNWLS